MEESGLGIELYVELGGSWIELISLQRIFFVGDKSDFNIIFTNLQARKIGHTIEISVCFR
jgi:hypothetical protein